MQLQDSAGEQRYILQPKQCTARGKRYAKRPDSREPGLLAYIWSVQPMGNLLQATVIT